MEAATWRLLKFLLPLYSSVFEIGVDRDLIKFLFISRFVKRRYKKISNFSLQKDRKKIKDPRYESRTIFITVPRFRLYWKLEPHPYHTQTTRLIYN